MSEKSQKKVRTKTEKSKKKTKSKKNMTFQQIAEETGYSYGHLKNIGKVEALKLLEKQRTNIIEVKNYGFKEALDKMLGFIATLETKDFDSLKTKDKFYITLKTLEVYTKVGMMMSTLSKAEDEF